MKTVIKILKNIGLVILGFFSLLILWFSFWYWYEKGEDIKCILPNNYQGGVIILCNKNDGVSEKYNENGERLYEIPNNGVLKTKFDFQDGKRYKIKYFYKSGRELRYLWSSDKVWEDTINLKSIYKDSIYVYGLSYANDFWFLVGKPKNRCKNYKILDKMWDKISINTKK